MHEYSFCADVQYYCSSVRWYFAIIYHPFHLENITRLYSVVIYGYISFYINLLVIEVQIFFSLVLDKVHSPVERLELRPKSSFYFI